MEFKMRQEKVHELKQNFQAKLERLKKIYEDEAGEGLLTLKEISNNSREIDRPSGFKKTKKMKITKKKVHQVEEGLMKPTFFSNFIDFVKKKNNNDLPEVHVLLQQNLDSVQRKLGCLNLTKL